MSLGLTVATSVFYALSLLFYIRLAIGDRRAPRSMATLLLVIGLATQYLALLQRSHWVHSVPYDDLYGSVSLLGWFLGVIYLGLELFYRQPAVGMFVVPLLLPLNWVGLHRAGATAASAMTRGNLFALHVTLTMFGYAGFALAGLLSAAFLIEAHGLRGHRPGRFLWRLPPLETLELLSRASVIVGLLAVAAGTTCGLLWQYRLQGRILVADPKVIATLVLSGLYGLYLAVWGARNWRGTRASLLCVLNLLLVLFSYTAVNLYFSRFHRFF
jgi:ABC-type transport system involved in cytochrome c biogenesis permease subunit